MQTRRGERSFLFISCCTDACIQLLLLLFFLVMQIFSTFFSWFLKKNILIIAILPIYFCVQLSTYQYMYAYIVA